MEALSGDGPALIYVHDPMCSWCWAFTPAHGQLMAALPPGLATLRLLGGLAPDSDEPMPPDMREYLEATWKRIQQQVPGTRFNFEFWTRNRPRRSTWPACRGVIAAREQGPEHDEAMTRAIQRAYYLEARNPSDADTLIECARSLGLDEARFAADLDSPPVRHALAGEIQLSRQLGVQGFPALVLKNGAHLYPVPVNYTDAPAMLNHVNRFLDA